MAAMIRVARGSPGRASGAPAGRTASRPGGCPGAAIATPGGCWGFGGRRAIILPREATRYVPPDKARALADDLVELGLAERADGGRYRLRFQARTFGGTLEWWVGRELTGRLGFDVATGVRSGARGVGGDLDVIAAAEGKLVYVELKSSPPKHIAASEVGAFLRRVRALRPHVSLFAVDTALRLSDKVLPMLADALARSGRTPGPGRRILRENWEVAPHVYAVNARQDLLENVCTAIADGLLSLGPSS